MLKCKGATGRIRRESEQGGLQHRSGFFGIGGNHGRDDNRSAGLIGCSDLTEHMTAFFNLCSGQIDDIHPAKKVALSPSLPSVTQPEIVPLKYKGSALSGKIWSELITGLEKVMIEKRTKSWPEKEWKIESRFPGYPFTRFPFSIFHSFLTALPQTSPTLRPTLRPPVRSLSNKFTPL